MANRANCSGRHKRKQGKKEQQRMMRRQLRKFSVELKLLRKQEVERFKRQIEEARSRPKKHRQESKDRKQREIVPKIGDILCDGIKQWINGVLM